ncbi:hypothetical protein ACFLTE_09930 [Bacteroidota bacterium]
MKKINSLILISLIITQLYSQDELKNFELNGYLSDMTMYLKSDLANIKYLDHNIHNRLNFHWYTNDYITTSIQLRNQFIIGDRLRADSSNIMKDELEDDFLSYNLIEEDVMVLNSKIDRLWVKFTYNKWDITLGRQRINWGQTYVFNSNDIFNAYSFFDFDYPERPGSDAIRIQYYPSYTSTIEAAVKYEDDSTITAAGLYRFSKWDYDIQLIGGIYNSDNLVFGGGWAGNIKDFSFSGELSYMHPHKDFSDTSGLLFASMNLNYMFSNSLMIQAEGFYNQYAGKYDLSFADLMASEQDIKSLSISEITLFANASYPFNPLTNSSISIMYYPDKKGYAIYPSFDFSISDKATFSIIGMYFTGEFEYPFIGKKRDEMYLGFLRFKYNF